MTETVEYAIRCADGRRIHYDTWPWRANGDVEEVRLIADRVADRGDAPSWCGGKPHTVVSRRRIVTDWEPVGGEQ